MKINLYSTGVFIYIIGLAVVIMMSLGGCSSLQYAGTADYSVAPIVLKSGETVCCKVRVKNGKEIGELEATMVTNKDGYSVRLKETSIKAFEGQRITGEVAKVGTKAAAKIGAAALKLLPVP